MSGSTAAPARTSTPDDRAARESLAYRARPCGVLDVTGADRVAFLQGQLTQDVKVEKDPGAPSGGTAFEQEEPAQRDTPIHD